MIDKFSIDIKSKNSCGFYRVNDFIEFCVNKKQDFNRNFKDGYPVETLENILKFKQNRNLPKDAKDIINIQNYLAKENEENKS